MNSAYQAKLGTEGLLNDVFLVLSDKPQSLSSTGNVSVFDLLSKNQPFLDKMEKLRDYRAQLVLVKKGTPEYLATSTEALNIIGEIIRENWNEFPVSVKENLKEKLSFSYFIRNALSSPIKILLAIIKSFQLIPMAFSEKSEFLKLQKSNEKAISNILSIGSEIRDYGHPLNYEGSDFPLKSSLISFDTGNETIYLSPSSAEGKALERIRESKGDTSDWETIVQPGQVVDLEEISKWLDIHGFTQ